MENNIAENDPPIITSQQPAVPPKSNALNKIVAPLVVVETIALLIVGYYVFQNRSTKQANAPQPSPANKQDTASNTSSPSPSPSPSNFKYIYLTQEEYKQKIISALVNANKDKQDYKINDQDQLINTAVKDYLALDEFTKWVVSTCPSTFTTSSQIVSTIDSAKLPFKITGSRKILCTGSSLTPSISYFSVNISAEDFGTTVFDTTYNIMGYKAAGDGMYGMSSSEVLNKIANLSEVDGVKIETRSIVRQNNGTGEITGYLNYVYAYKQFPNYIVVSYAAFNDKTDSKFSSLDVAQYPNIDPVYKKVIDRLTNLVNMVEPK
jgi:hypothetical protein